SRDFAGPSVLLRTFTRADLVADATNRHFSSPAGLTVTLPGSLSSGRHLIGLRIVPDPVVGDANPSDDSGVHRGLDLEPLTVVTRASQGITDLSQIDANLRSATDRILFTPDQVDTFTFTVTNNLGSGRLTAEVVATSGTLLPRLSLLGPNGQLLIQSD